MIFLSLNKKSKDKFFQINSKGHYLIFEILSGIIYFLIFSVALFSQNNISLLFRIIGLIVYFSGLILTFIGYHIFTKEKDLIQKFPFNFSRNPTYFFSFVSIFGIVLFTNSLILFSMLIIQFISTYIIILREEEFLEKRYGKEYLDYKSKVKRYI